MKPFAAVTLAVLLLLAWTTKGADQPAWKGEPTSFGGVRLGAPLAEVEKHLGTKCKPIRIGWGPFAPKPLYSHECTTDLMVADVGTFPFKFFMKDGVLALVQLSMATAPYSRIRDAFVAKYGPPTGTSMGVVRGDVDVAQDRPARESESVGWTGVRVSISLGEYSEVTTWVNGQPGPKRVEPGELRIVYKTDKDIAEEAKRPTAKSAF